MEMSQLNRYVLTIDYQMFFFYNWFWQNVLKVFCNQITNFVKIQGSLTQVVREYATRKFSDKMRHVSSKVLNGDYLTIFLTFVYLLGHPVSIVHMYA